MDSIGASATPQIHEIIASQLAADSEIEDRYSLALMRILLMGAEGADILWL